ncbi:hypothetical protein DSO57_1018468 [Entomophthora muscae]|uniref:Uncharacterized protein n=1 Tax=Entomophthora muscae TaxID=34485 RepID=A0ACC2S666_9FUNG|nr:hypothetical protein DSO57_1018468 [Entomophthora muscae]
MKLITLISLAGALQATRKFSFPGHEPIPEEIHKKFAPDFFFELFDVSMENPGIAVPSKTNDGTCMKLYCLGCKENNTLRPLVRDLWIDYDSPKSSNNNIKNAKGCNCILMYSQKDSCLKAEEEINQLRKTYKLPPLKKTSS